MTEAAVAVHKRGTYLLRRCGDGERWAGLWDFPRFELSQDHAPSRDPAQRARMVGEQLYRLTGVKIADLQHVTTIHHGVTRFRIELLCLTAVYRDGRLTGGIPPLRWVRPRDFEEYPLSTTARRFAHLLLS